MWHCMRRFIGDSSQRPSQRTPSKIAHARSFLSPRRRARRARVPRWAHSSSITQKPASPTPPSVLAGQSGSPSKAAHARLLPTILAMVQLAAMVTEAHSVKAQRSRACVQYCHSSSRRRPQHRAGRPENAPCATEHIQEGVADGAFALLAMQRQSCRGTACANSSSRHSRRPLTSARPTKSRMRTCPAFPHRRTRRHALAALKSQYSPLHTQQTSSPTPPSLPARRSGSWTWHRMPD